MKLNFILKACAVISFIILIVYSYYRIPNVSFGFVGYYTFSKMLLEGDNLSLAYEAEHFNKKINDYGIKNIYELYNIVPTNVFVILPIASFNPLTSKITWGIFSLVILIFSLFLTLKIFDLKFFSNGGLLTAIIFFLWHPVYENLSYGQVYILLLFLFLLSIYGIKHNRKFLAAVGLSLNILFKGYGTIVYLWLAVIKRYKILLISFAVVILIIIFTLPIIGFNTWKTFIEITFSTLGRFNEDSIIVYQNLNGLFRHLLVYDKTINPNSIANIPSNIVFTFVIIFNLFIVILFLIKSKKIISSEKNKTDVLILSYSAIIAVSVTTAPMAEEYHYALYLPLVVGLGKYFFENVSGKNSGMLIKSFLKTPNIFYVIAVILILLPLNYRIFQTSHFPLYLLGYPKLYGGIILLTLYYLIPNGFRER